MVKQLDKIKRFECEKTKIEDEGVKGRQEFLITDFVIKE
jgi:hypothetical protein